MARPPAKMTGIYSALIAVGGDEKCKIPIERPAPELLLLHQLHSADGGLASPLSEVTRTGETEIGAAGFYDTLAERYGAEPVRRVFGTRAALIAFPVEYDPASAEAEPVEA